MQRSETHQSAAGSGTPDYRRRDRDRISIQPRMMGYGLAAFTHPAAG